MTGYPNLYLWGSWSGTKITLEHDVCHKTMELSSSGPSALTDHAKRKKHDDAVKELACFTIA